jgi:hypothetical protein
MAGKGGYQRPTSPAPVSGPGSLSQRTDGGPAHKQSAKYISGLPYGQGQEMMSMQNSAPMEASAPTPNLVPMSQMGNGTNTAGEPMPVIPLSAPDQNPEEPVTSGVDAGAGPGMASLGLGSRDVAADNNFKTSLAAYMPVLMQVAARPNTSPETRSVIRQLRDLL